MPATVPVATTTPRAPGRPAESRSPRSRAALAILDDDRGFVAPLRNRLAALGYRAEVCEGHSLPDALDAVVVDPAALGYEDASSYISELITARPRVAVLVCTGPTRVADRVRGLRRGADDWITKPCHPEEVVARIEAVLRRQADDRAPKTFTDIRAGEITLRDDLFDALAHGSPLSLTRREFELLRVLITAAGRVLSREDMYKQVWGYEMAHGDRSVDVFVRKLRRKLKQASPEWSYIQTHFGVGYRFDARLIVQLAHA